MLDMVKKHSNGIRDSITSRDIYGKPIHLNYNGDDSFKTCPGGVISIFVMAIIVMYTALKTL